MSLHEALIFENEGNTDALLSDMKRMRIDPATTAVDVKTLRLTVEEYKQYRTEDAEKLKNWVSS